MSGVAHRSDMAQRCRQRLIMTRCLTSVSIFSTLKLTFVLYCLNEQQIAHIKLLKTPKCSCRVFATWLTNSTNRNVSRLGTRTKFHFAVETYYLTQHFGVSRNKSKLYSRGCFVSHICAHNITFFRRTPWATLSRWVVYGERKLEPVTV